MRKIIGLITLLLVAAVAVLWAVQSARAGSPSGTQQIVFNTANGAAIFDYITPTPPKPDAHFGFWIWCEGPASQNDYVGNCNGAMYFYAFGITRPVNGTVSGSGGLFTMKVWSTDSTIACSLMNGTAFTGHGSERQTITVSCPGSTGLSPTVTGSGTVDDAEVNVTGQ